MSASNRSASFDRFWAAYARRNAGEPMLEERVAKLERLMAEVISSLNAVGERINDRNAT